MKLSFTLLLIVVFAGCRRQPSPTVFIDPALAVLVPSDTTLLAGIRMQRIRATRFFEEVSVSPRFTNFRKSMGLVGDSDIWEYVIASNGVEWVALLRGKFTEMGMEPRIHKPSARHESYNGVPVVGDKEGAIAFLNPTTAIAGPFEVVLRTLERRNTNSGIPDGLQKLTEEIPSANEAWFTSIGPVPFFLAVSPIKKGRGAFDPHTRAWDLSIEVDSAELARSIAETVHGRAEGTHVTAQGPVPTHVIDWMLGRTVPMPAAR